MDARNDDPLICNTHFAGLPGVLLFKKATLR